MYQRVRDLLGVALPEARALLAGRYLAYDLVEDAERRTVRIRTHDGAAEYGAEELAAMVLRYAAELARTHSKAPIRDAVLTVPPFWGQRQRQALLDAAHIAGLKVSCGAGRLGAGCAVGRQTRAGARHVLTSAHQSAGGSRWGPAHSMHRLPECTAGGRLVYPACSGWGQGASL